MPMGDLLELIVCTECKTRVEYHEERDGYMSCECWIRSTADDPTPDKWVEIEDRKVNLCGGCRANIPERSIFRCADCGLPFHQTCLDQHCKHGNQKQELRSENLFLKSQLAEKEGQLCKAREVFAAARRFYDANGTVDWRTAKGVGEWNEAAVSLNGLLHGVEKEPSSPCPHAKEAERSAQEIKELKEKLRVRDMG